MSATTTKRKIGFATIVSSLFILAMLILGVWSFFQMEAGLVRTHDPHEEYEDVAPWPYDLDWAGGRSNWFDDVNYSDIPLDQELPEDLLEQMENVVFWVEPAEPPQLWRTGAYDDYDGSNWGKSQSELYEATTISRSEAINQGNEIYQVYMNMSAGSSVGQVELPTLFPEIQVIEDSFETGELSDGRYQSDTDSRLISYEIETDDYGTLLFSPLLEGSASDYVIVSYEVTYASQDLENVANNALDGTSAPLAISSLYSTLAGVDITERVTNETDLFRGQFDNAYQAALAVDQYFKSNYELMIDEDEYMERPEDGREVTDWFIERGGGLPMDFATSYCVFMRDLDIPARLAIGYAVGDAENGHRTIRVRHMMFWAEVFIPMLGSPTGGEWIQVLPIPLPSDMGGGEIPANTGEGDVELYVFPSNPEDPNSFWAPIGGSFNLSSILIVQGVPVSAPEEIYFYDETDSVEIGTATIERGSLLPLANITHTFPENSTAGLHNITATWTGNNFSITNYTGIYAVGSANPFSGSGQNKVSTGFTLSETVDLNVKLGLDNYTAVWEDTVHVYGVLTVGGNPVDGTTLENDQMQIMWDELWIGNATIQSDGTYSYDIYVDPADLIRMTVGPHEVWAQYLGEYDPVYGFPIIFPGRSADNSTVAVWGAIDVDLTVTPTSVYKGQNINYDGVAYYLNGTALVGESIELVFDNAVVGTTAPTNASGGFNSDYTVPVGKSSGDYNAYVNWTSTQTNITDGTSNSFIVTVESGETDLSIDSIPKSPDVVHPYQNIIISGYLTDAINGSGIVGREIQIWWSNSSGDYLLGTNTTIADGYYEYTYTVTVSELGSVTYWSEFASSEPSLLSSQSDNLTITVQQWIVEVTIQASPDPVHLLETVTISGQVLLPEIPGALQGASVSIWWTNSSGEFYLGANTTDVTGWYYFDHKVAITHNLETVSVKANFTSPDPGFMDDESPLETLAVTNYDTSLTIFSNSTYYHLNETAHISGVLLFENSSPVVGRTVDVYWDWNNGTVEHFPVLTNGTGGYSLLYNLSLDDGEATVDVSASFTSLTILYDNSTASLSPSLTIQLYQVALSANLDSTTYHLDEVLDFSGTLYYNEGNKPISGATVAVYYKNTTSTYTFFKTTNSTGGFQFLYNFTLDDALGAIYVWATYTSTNPQLWESAQSANRSATVILYQMSLTLTTNGTSYHLDEVVWVQGQLTFQDNGTALDGESITIFWEWENGTVLQFPGYITDGSGYYNFYYNCSLPKDQVATVTIWSEFNNSVALWDNATSSTRDIDLILYVLEFSMTVPGSAYLDLSLPIQGVLTYQGGSPVLVGETVNIYIWEGSYWSLLGTRVTNSTGGFEYVHNFTVPPDGEGTSRFKCNYSSTDPLNADATTGNIDVLVSKQNANLDISVTPTTEYLNESISITIQLSFANGTPLVGESVSLWWDNGTAYLIATITTDGTGSYTYIYSSMSEDTILTGIEVYATFTGTDFLKSNESVHETVTLQRWATTISGFGTDGSDYRPTETVTVTGTLYYIDGTVPITGVTVEILVDGTPVDTATTASDGSFTGYWVIPQSTAPGTYDVSVRYTSGVNWISNHTTSATSVSVDSYYLVWSFDVQPRTAYRKEYIHLSGSIDLDNGTAYAGATVTFHWVFVGGTSGEIFLGSDVTALDGSFDLWVQIATDEELGQWDVWAACVPTETYISSSNSSTISIDIEQISVSLTADTDVDTVYLGGTVIISGTLTFGNGTSMVGYDVIIYWDGSEISTEQTDSVGDFSYSYDVAWDQQLGDIDWSVVFNSPSQAIANASDSGIVEVRDLVNLYLDSQTVTSIQRGESLTVSGYVTNGDGDVQGLTVEITFDGSVWGTAITRTDGTFSVSLDIPTDSSIDTHIVNLTASEDYYDIDTTDWWEISIVAGTELSVILDRVDIMPGEAFDIDVQIQLDDGSSISDNLQITVYLNDTEVGTTLLTEAGVNTESITVPLDWSGSAGFYVVSLEYDGNTLYGASDATSEGTIHIFTAPEFIQSTDTYSIRPNATLFVSGQLVDENGIAIIGRTLRIYMNRTSSYNDLTTGTEGDITYQVLARAPEGRFWYSVELRSIEVSDIDLGEFTVQIQEPAGPIPETTLTFALVIAIAIEIILALVVIARYRSKRW